MRLPLLAAAAVALPAALLAQTPSRQPPTIELRRATTAAASDTADPTDAPDTAFAARERARLARRGLKPPALPGEAKPVRPIAPGSSGFAVRVESDAPEYRVYDDETVDPIRIVVESSEDGYLTLLAGGTGPDLTVLAPNDLAPELPVRAGDLIEFPFPEWQRQGYELYPHLPEGATQSQQTIIAVVTRRPIPLPIADYGYVDAGGATVPLRVFQRWLARIPLRDRGVSQALFLVRAP